MLSDCCYRALRRRRRVSRLDRISTVKSLASYRDCLGRENTGAMSCSGRGSFDRGDLKGSGTSPLALWSLNGFPFAMNELRAFYLGVGQRKTEPELLHHSDAAYHRKQPWPEATSFKSAYDHQPCCSGRITRHSERGLGRDRGGSYQERPFSHLFMVRTDVIWGNIGRSCFRRRSLRRRNPTD